MEGEGGKENEGKELGKLHRGSVERNPNDVKTSLQGLSQGASQCTLLLMMRYRPNVAVLLLRDDGKLLVCERQKVKGAWQFPQGGVDEGETLEEGLKREVKEEIGIDPSSYDILDMKGGYRYIYPPTLKKAKRKGWYDGQEQTYYRCLLHDASAKIDVDQKPREFRDYQWIQPKDFQLEWLPEFKHEVYRKVMWDFFEVKI